MAINYAKIVLTVERLLTANGRLVLFVRQSEIAADPNKPWEGPTSTEVTAQKPVVAVPPNTVRQFGLTALGEGTEFVDLITHSERILITFPGTDDLRQYSTVRDEGINWGILGIQVLKPGATQVLAFVGVRR